MSSIVGESGAEIILQRTKIYIYLQVVILFLNIAYLGQTGALSVMGQGCCRFE
jgi:hypothetical protein